MAVSVEGWLWRAVRALGVGLLVSGARVVQAAPNTVLVLQERTAADSRGEVARFAALEFVSQVRGEQFRNPPLPSETEYKLFAQNFFKDKRYFLWQGGGEAGTVSTVLPEKIPSLYGSLEAPVQATQPLLPLSELDLVIATDQPLKAASRKPVSEEVLGIVDGLARAAFVKEGLSAEVSAQVPRVWFSAAFMPGRPNAVVALYRRTLSLKQRDATYRRILNQVIVAEPITEKGQTTWRAQMNLVSLGNPETATLYGPLAVVDLNGDGFEDLLVRETHFDRWNYGIYSRYQDRWQSRYSGREGNYSAEIPEPDEEPTP